MSGQAWCITIVAGTQHASFIPDVYGAGAVLQATQGDEISWSNQTQQEHEIWLTDQEYQQRTRVTEQINPGQSSRPGYVPQTKDASPPAGATPNFPLTIYYACSIHPEERGTISLVS